MPDWILKTRILRETPYCGGVNNFLVSIEQMADLSLLPARYLLKRNEKCPIINAFLVDL
jgi:hypothetical protein